ncbi:MAG: hypothetical protein FWC34_01015 [Bacteroidetes bacterium]|nr:hypothetical protein [Bacteroidota bacterium]
MEKKNGKRKKGVGFDMSWHAVPNGFRKAIEASEISVYAQVVYDHLCAEKDNELKAASSCREIAAARNISCASAKRALKELKKLGWITAEPRLNAFGNKIGNWYYINELPPGTVISHSDDREKADLMQELVDVQASLTKEELRQEINRLKAASAEPVQHAEDVPNAPSEKPPETPPTQEPEAVNESTKAHGEYENVLLTSKEYESLVKEYGQETTEQYINELGSYMASSNKTYPGHYATVRRWIERDKKNKQDEQTKANLPIKRNRFNNFKSHKRDYAEIERLEMAYLIRKVEGEEGYEAYLKGPEAFKVYENEKDKKQANIKRNDTNGIRVCTLQHQREQTGHRTAKAGIKSFGSPRALL